MAVEENETLDDGTMQLREGQTEDVLQLAQKNVLLVPEASITPAKMAELLAEVDDVDEKSADGEEQPKLEESSDDGDDDAEEELGRVMMMSNQFLNLGSKFALKAPKAAPKPKAAPVKTKAKAAPVKAKAAKTTGNRRPAPSAVTS